ncbi:MAG: hypothetical protein V4692_12960 [Bdellovibrionota bacterium]
MSRVSCAPMRFKIFLVLALGLTTSNALGAACPAALNETQCSALAQVDCAFAGTDFICADRNDLEYDEGSWRTSQIRAVAEVISALSEGPEKAALEKEFGQIRLTGVWRGSVTNKHGYHYHDGYITISRKNRTQLEVEAWWLDSEGQPSGIHLPLVATYRGEALDFGAGSFGSGKISMDLRKMGEDSYKFEFNEVGSVVVTSNDRWGGSEGIERGGFKRDDEGSLADKKRGFRKAFLSNKLSGTWEGPLNVNECSTRPNGVRNSRIEMLFLWGRIDYKELDLDEKTESGFPRVAAHRYYRFYRYEILPHPETKTLFGDGMLKMDSDSPKWGAKSSSLWEVSNDGNSLLYKHADSLFGGGVSCQIDGTLLRVK